MWSMAEREQPGLFAQLVTVPLFHEHRILCQVAGHGLNVVKALPALVVSEEDVRSFAAALDDVLAGAERVPRAYARFGVRMARGLRRTAT
jgi:ornithine--oxo-acid transaminase